MKIIFILCLSLFNFSLPAEELSAPLYLEFGTYNTLNGEINDYKIENLKVHLVSSTQTATIVLPGCYLSKENTGESFPYGTKYYPKEHTSNAVYQYEDSFELQRGLDISNIENAVAKNRAQFRKELPVYCLITTSLVIEADLRADQNPEEIQKGIYALHYEGQGIFSHSSNQKISAGDPRIKINLSSIR